MDYYNLAERLKEEVDTSPNDSENEVDSSPSLTEVTEVPAYVNESQVQEKKTIQAKQKSEAKSEQSESSKCEIYNESEEIWTILCELMDSHSASVSAARPVDVALAWQVYLTRARVRTSCFPSLYTLESILVLFIDAKWIRKKDLSKFEKAYGPFEFAFSKTFDLAFDTTGKRTPFFHGKINLSDVEEKLKDMCEGSFLLWTSSIDLSLKLSYIYVNTNRNNFKKKNNTQSRSLRPKRSMRHYAIQNNAAAGFKIVYRTKSKSGIHRVQYTFSFFLVSQFLKSSVRIKLQNPVCFIDKNTISSSDETTSTASNEPSTEKRNMVRSADILELAKPASIAMSAHVANSCTSSYFTLSSKLNSNNTNAEAAVEEPEPDNNRIELGSHVYSIKCKNDSLDEYIVILEKEELTAVLLEQVLSEIKTRIRHGRYTEAEELCVCAFEHVNNWKDSKTFILNKIGIDQSRDSSQTHYTHASCYCNPCLAIRCFACIYSSLGEIYYRNKRYKEAIFFYERSLPILREIGHVYESPTVLSFLFASALNVGDMYRIKQYGLQSIGCTQRMEKRLTYLDQMDNAGAKVDAAEVDLKDVENEISLAVDKILAPGQMVCAICHLMTALEKTRLGKGKGSTVLRLLEAKSLILLGIVCFAMARTYISMNHLDEALLLLRTGTCGQQGENLQLAALSSAAEICKRIGWTKTARKYEHQLISLGGDQSSCSPVPKEENIYYDYTLGHYVNQ